MSSFDKLFYGKPNAGERKTLYPEHERDIDNNVHEYMLIFYAKNMSQIGYSWVNADGFKNLDQVALYLTSIKNFKAHCDMAQPCPLDMEHIWQYSIVPLYKAPTFRRHLGESL